MREIHRVRAPNSGGRGSDPTESVDKVVLESQLHTKSSTDCYLSLTKI